VRNLIQVILYIKVFCRHPSQDQSFHKEMVIRTDVMVGRGGDFYGCALVATLTL
jgi:hypothetical protein